LRIHRRARCHLEGISLDEYLSDWKLLQTDFLEDKKPWMFVLYVCRFYCFSRFLYDYFKQNKDLKYDMIFYDMIRYYKIL